MTYQDGPWQGTRKIWQENPSHRFPGRFWGFPQRRFPGKRLQALDGVDGVSQSGAILILAQLANKLTNISGGEAQHVGRRTLLPTCSPKVLGGVTKHHHSSPAFGAFPVMMVIPMVGAGCPQLWHGQVADDDEVGGGLKNGGVSLARLQRVCD